MILFLTVLKFCLVFYDIYLEKIWRSLCARVGFHVSAHYRYCRRFRKRWRSRELRRARLRLLWTRQACLNLWYDRCFCMFAWEVVRGIWVSGSTSLLVKQLPACSKVAMISGERWPNHVVAWRVARWYYCSIPALRHLTTSDVNVDGVTLSFFSPSVLPHVSFARMRFSKLVTSFRVHTKHRGRDDGTLAQD